MSQIRSMVWPTLWPIAVMTLVIVPIAGMLPARLWAVAMAAAAGGLSYAATFLAFAVKRDERRAYLAKASELTWVRRRVAAAA